MGSTGNDHQLLVASGQLFEGVFAEIAGMRLFAVDQQACRTDFSAVRKKLSVEKRKSRTLVLSCAGINGSVSL